MKNRTAAMMIVAATATAALSGAKTAHAGYRLDIEYTTSVQGSAWIQSDASHYEDLSHQVWREANQTCWLQQGRGWRWTSWEVDTWTTRDSPDHPMPRTYRNMRIDAAWVCE